MGMSLYRGRPSRWPRQAQSTSRASVMSGGSGVAKSLPATRVAWSPCTSSTAPTEETNGSLSGVPRARASTPPRRICTAMPGIVTSLAAGVETRNNHPLSKSVSLWAAILPDPTWLARKDAPWPQSRMRSMSKRSSKQTRTPPQKLQQCQLFHLWSERSIARTGGGERIQWLANNCTCI
jgi:hypothetical protein